MKSLINDIEIGGVRDALDILAKAGTEDLFEKAKHQIGDSHPTWPQLKWTDLGNGKFGWRTGTGRGKRASTSSNVGQASVGNAGEQKDLSTHAKETDTKTLKNVANSDKAPKDLKDAAKKELQNRGEQTESTTKYSPEMQKLFDAFRINSNKYTDPNKMSIETTPKGNWAIKYDGKRVATIRSLDIDKDELDDLGISIEIPNDEKETTAKTDTTEKKKKSKHQVGDSHPTWPQLKWTDLGGGKFGWRTDRGKKTSTSNSGEQASQAKPAKTDTTEKMSSKKVADAIYNEMLDFSKKTSKQKIHNQHEDWAKHAYEVFLKYRDKGGPKTPKEFAYIYCTTPQENMLVSKYISNRENGMDHDEAVDKSSIVITTPWGNDEYKLHKKTKQKPDEKKLRPVGTGTNGPERRKEASNKIKNIEDVKNLPIGTFVSGGGYKYVKMGKNNYWMEVSMDGKTTIGNPRLDSRILELTDFSDFKVSGQAKPANTTTTETKVGDVSKLTAQQKSMVDKVMDTGFLMLNNKYNDKSKVELKKTPKGNWRCYYDGKDIGTTISSKIISDATAKKIGWYKDVS